MADTKFCVDCRHYRFVDPFGRFGGPVFIECHHPSAPRDLVHGVFPTCAGQRLDVGHCGPEATRFQRKPVEQPQPKPARRFLWWSW